MDRSPATVTALLRAWSCGDRGAYERLIELVYAELRRLAAHHLQRERSEHTLQPTALVHEAYLKLVVQENASLQSRTQFFAVAAQAMRRVLVDHARGRSRSKRGGDVVRVSLDARGPDQGSRCDSATAGHPRDVDLIDLDRALDELSELDAELVRVVELRHFAGLTIEETATAMDSSPATVKRAWSTARAWLFNRLGGAA